MTAVLAPTQPAIHADRSEISPADPFRYGWREIQQAIPGGGVQWERIPLSLEDVLHPQVGDYRMHSDEHERFCVYLYDVLTLLLANDPLAIVLHDVRVAWDDPNVKPHGPDIAVIFNVRQQRNWSTFDVVEEGVKPTLLIEVTSPQTRSIDLINKVDEYEQVGVPYYVIVDSWRRKKGVVRQLIGYRLTADGYEPMAPNDKGWLWLEPVKAWLALDGANLACYDEKGQYIERFSNMAAARIQAEARAALAEAKAATAEARALSAEARAEAEVRIHTELEEKLRQLERELKELRNSRAS
ncbi:MAG: Uma2 family endonuclease [Chloroflexota bacterium]